MNDVTASFDSLRTRLRDKWGPETETFVREAAAAVSGEVEWDSDAGEDWARIFDSSEKLVAYLYVLAPLAICLRRAPIGKALPTEAAVVEVDDFGGHELRADPSALSALFGQGVLLGNLRPDAFSAEELWFWTV